MDKLDSIISRIETLEDNINRRMDTMERNRDAHMKMCQDMCDQRLVHLEESIGLAHYQINEHTKMIDANTQYRNKMVGAIGIILIIIGIVGWRLFSMIINRN